MKPCLLVVSLIIFSSCIKPVELDVKETRSLFSQLYIFKQDSWHRNPLVIDSVYYNDGIILEYCKESPLANDIAYIKQQLVSRSLIKWQHNVFDTLKIVSRKQLDSLSKPDSFTNTPMHVQVSKPYFSRNKKYCLLCYRYYCGNLCAENAVNIYRKVNGKWRFVKSLMRVVS